MMIMKDKFEKSLKSDTWKVNFSNVILLSDDK